MERDHLFAFWNKIKYKSEQALVKRELFQIVNAFGKPFTSSINFITNPNSSLKRISQESVFRSTIWTKLNHSNFLNLASSGIGEPLLVNSHNVVGRYSFYKITGLWECLCTVNTFSNWFSGTISLDITRNDENNSDISQNSSN